MKENLILETCLQKLNTLPRLGVHVEALELTMGGTGIYERRVDALIEVADGPERWHGLVEVKTHLTRERALHAANQVQQLCDDWREPGMQPFVMGDYVRETVADVFRERNINFADTAGNAFINLPDGPFILVQGRKPEVHIEKRKGRLYQPTGLKVLLTLLLDQEAVNWPYRAIAKDAGIALGNIGQILEELDEEGYAERFDNNRARMRNIEDLVGKWVDGYAEKLRPKMFIGRYRARTKDNAEVLDKARDFLDQRHIEWEVTGGFAADMLTHHYQGEELTLLVKGWQPGFEAELGWMPDKNGPITILAGFGRRIMYPFDVMDCIPMAHPLVTYAELLNDGRERAVETAGMLYRDHVQGHLG